MLVQLNCFQLFDIKDVKAKCNICQRNQTKFPYTLKVKVKCVKIKILLNIFDLFDHHQSKICMMQGHFIVIAFVDHSFMDV